MAEEAKLFQTKSPEQQSGPSDNTYGVDEVTQHETASGDKSNIATGNKQEIAKKNDGAGLVQVVDLDPGNIANLEKQLRDADAAPFELTDGYWTPGSMGESKRLILKEIKMMKFVSQAGEEVELETACLVEIEKGIAKNVTNAAWRLVKSLKNFSAGSAFLITYLGKRKNSTNGNMSDDFSIKPLMVKMGGA